MQRLLPKTVSELSILNGYSLESLYIDFPLINTYHDRLLSYILFSLVFISFFLALSFITRYLLIYLKGLKLNFYQGNLVKGFTLIELLVVIAIIAVLAVMAFAAFGGLTGKGNDDRRAADMKAFANVMEVVRAKASASVYTAPAATDFGGGVFPKEPTSRTEHYCYLDSTSAPLANMPTSTTTACGGTYVDVNGIAPTVTLNALYFKFCTMNDISNATRAVICQGSRQ